MEYRLVHIVNEFIEQNNLVSNHMHALKVIVKWIVKGSWRSHSNRRSIITHIVTDDLNKKCVHHNFGKLKMKINGVFVIRCMVI